MGFSSQEEKGMPTRDRSVLNCRVSHNQVKNLARGNVKDSNHKHTKKPAAVHPELDIGGTEVKKQLCSTEGLSDESNWTWLSHNCMPSVLLSSDDLLDAQQLDCRNRLLNDQISKLALYGSCGSFLDIDMGLSFFDGSRISPIVEASLVLDGTQDGISEELQREEEIVRWLSNSVENEETDYSRTCSESGDYSYQRSFSEDSTCTSISSIHDGVSSNVRDFDRSSLCSLLDHESEDSQLLWLHIFGYADFSRRCKSIKNFQFGSSETAEANLDDPIFWPFDQNSYWHSDFENFLCISPSNKYENLIGMRGHKNLKSFNKRLHQKSNKLLASKKYWERCRRKITFASTPASKGKVGGPEFRANKISDMARRLSSSTRAVRYLAQNLEANEEKHHVDKIASHSSLRLEAGDLHDFVAEELPIEKLVGLNEFDGHEGIDLEFNVAQFSLVGLL